MPYDYLIVALYQLLNTFYPTVFLSKIVFRKKIAQKVEIFIVYFLYLSILLFFLSIDTIVLSFCDVFQLTLYMF